VMRFILHHKSASDKAWFVEWVARAGPSYSYC